MIADDITEVTHMLPFGKFMSLRIHSPDDISPIEISTAYMTPSDILTENSGD
jgi:hypothetical protein